MSDCILAWERGAYDLFSLSLRGSQTEIYSLILWVLCMENSCWLPGRVTTSGVKSMGCISYRGRTDWQYSGGETDKSTHRCMLSVDFMLSWSFPFSFCWHGIVRSTRWEGISGGFIQISAQSRSNFKARSGCWGPFPVKFLIIPRKETPRLFQRVFKCWIIHVGKDISLTSVSDYFPFSACSRCLLSLCTVLLRGVSFVFYVS